MHNHSACVQRQHSVFTGCTGCGRVWLYAYMHSTVTHGQTTIALAREAHSRCRVAAPVAHELYTRRVVVHPEERRMHNHSACVQRHHSLYRLWAGMAKYIQRYKGNTRVYAVCT